MVEKMKVMKESVLIEKEIPEEYMCPISGEMMKDPVMTKNGHNYERKEIEEWIEKSGTDPQDRSELRKSDLRPNRQLKEAIERHKKEVKEQKSKGDKNTPKEYKERIEELENVIIGIKEEVDKKSKDKKNILEEVKPRNKFSDFNSNITESEIKKLMGGRFMGVGEWLKLGKKVNDAPEIRLEMVKYLKLECEVRSNGKKVHETHQLVLIPKGVSVEDMHRLCVGKKSDSKMHNFSDKFEGKNAGKEDVWTTKGMEASYWSLMYVGDRSVDNGVIPGSRSKTWDDQVKVFNEVNGRIGGVYEIIGAREATLSTLMRYMSTGEKILTWSQSNQPNTGTRTLDHWDKNGWGDGWRVYVGQFDGDGLRVHNLNCGDYGLGMVRKYR
jgi:hypothetical protein